MAKSSSRGYFEPYDASSYNDGEPVSARRTWLLANSLQHLVDQSTQLRVNWTADIDGTRITFDEAAGDFEKPHWWAQEFPLTNVVAGRPCNLDILVRGSISDAVGMAGHFQVRVTNAIGTVGSPNVDAIYDSGIVSITGTTDVTTVVNTQVFVTVANFPGFPNLKVKWPEAENGEFHWPEVHMARIEVSVTQDGTSDDEATIDGVYVREFV